MTNVKSAQMDMFQMPTKQNVFAQNAMVSAITFLYILQIVNFAGQKKSTRALRLKGFSGLFFLTLAYRIQPLANENLSLMFLSK